MTEIDPHEYVCPECGLIGVCPIGWQHTSIADLLLSQLMAADKAKREAS